MSEEKSLRETIDSQLSELERFISIRVDGLDEGKPSFMFRVPWAERTVKVTPGDLMRAFYFLSGMWLGFGIAECRNEEEGASETVRKLIEETLNYCTDRLVAGDPDSSPHGALNQIETLARDAYDEVA